MKKFEAKTTRGDADVRYIITAENEEAAQRKLLEISKDYSLKVKEI